MAYPDNDIEKLLDSVDLCEHDRHEIRVFNEFLKNVGRAPLVDGRPDPARKKLVEPWLGYVNGTTSAQDIEVGPHIPYGAKLKGS